jgi:hypothetical protein
MKPEEQRIAIAEACGYYKDNQYWCIRTEQGVVGTFDLPDYLNDLNAMRKAEKVLMKDKNLWDYYGHKLYWIVNGRAISSEALMKSGAASLFVHASADLRAVAFLKTLNLWDESK